MRLPPLRPARVHKDLFCRELKRSLPFSSCHQLKTTEWLEKSNVRFIESCPHKGVEKVFGKNDTLKEQQQIVELTKAKLETSLDVSPVEGQLNNGCEFHQCVKKLLQGDEIPKSIKDSTNLCIKSAQWVFKLITDVGSLESQVVHPQLAYRGVVDCIAKYRNKPVVIEWKRSDKPKPLLQYTYDAPLQLSAYMGGINYDPNYKFQVEGGLIVVAYSNGAPADIFPITAEECSNFWKKWLYRYQQYVMAQSSQK